MAINPTEVAKDLLSLLSEPPDEKVLRRLLDLFRANKAYEQTLKKSHLREEFIRKLKNENVGSKVYDLLSYLQSLSEGPGLGRDKSNLITAVTSDTYNMLMFITTRMHDMKIQLTDACVPQCVATDLSIHQPDYREQPEIKQLVSNGFAFMKNCSVLPELHIKLKEQIYETVKAYVDPEVNDIEMSIRAIVLTHDLDQNNTLSRNFYPPFFFEEIKRLFGSITYYSASNEFRAYYKNEVQTGAANVFICFLVLAKSQTYRCQLLTILNPFRRIIEEIMDHGKENQKTLLKELLVTLRSHSCEKCGGIFASEVLAKFGDVVIPPPRITSRPSFHGEQDVVMPSGGKCPYLTICERYLSQHLKVNEQYIDVGYSRCFCDNCMDERQDAPSYARGDPPTTYALPRGWVKFALLQPPRANVLKIWDKWHIGYHGTRPEKITTILDTGELLKPGDRNMEGEHIRPPKGHFDENWKPKDFDIKKVFLSPSIKYAGQEAYAPKVPFVDEQGRQPTQYLAQVAFQVRIRPGIYDISSETLGASKTGHVFDELFKNGELEWSTNASGATILTGIIVSVEPK